MYAGSAVLLAESPQNLQLFLNSLQDYTEKDGA